MDVNKQGSAQQLNDAGWRNLFMQAPIPIAILGAGPTFTIELANKYMLDYWGREHDKVIMQPALAVLPEAKEQGFELLLTHVYATGETLRKDEYPVQVVRNNQKVDTYVNFVFEPLKDKHGTVSGIMVIGNDITDSVITRRRVEESELRYKQLIETLPVAFYTCDKEGRIELFNSAAVKIWGRTPVPGKDMWCGSWKVYRADGKPHPIEEVPMAKALKEGKAVRGEEIIIERPDGSRVNALPYPEPVFNAEGKLVGAINMIVDITELKLAEQALRESEQRFRTVADAAPVLIWMTGADKLCSFLNYAWVEFSGRDIEEGLNEGWFESIHPDDFDEMAANFNAAFDARKEYNIEFRIKDKNGKYHWVADHGRPRYTNAGDFLGYIGICVNIDEQKATKENLERLVAQRTIELKDINMELKNQKEFLETILDSSVDIVAVFDRELRYLAVNKKCCEVYGMQRDEMVGRIMPEVFPQTIGNEFSQNVLKTFEDGQIHFTHHQSAIISKYYETYFVPLKRTDGEVESVIAIAHDQTEIVQAAEKLRRYNEELLTTNQKLEQFAYIASHDLQEPLRKIQTFSELLKNNINKPEAAEKYLTKINTSAQRMTALIKDVLNYSRLSKTGEEFTLTDLNTLVDSVKSDFELLIEQKNAVVTHAQLPVIKGIPLQLHQLFTNLMSNSLKFSSENPVIEITSRITSADEVKKLPFVNPAFTYIELTFKDNGIGFDQKYADQIFDIFHRLHERNTYSGTGIGLALCKKIAENHGGYIQATSQEGKGATFTIYLPV